MGARSAAVFVVGLHGMLVFAACGGQDTASTDSALAEHSASQTTASESLDPQEAAIERGRYLVEGPTHCFYCHSEIDWATPEFLEVVGRKGVGALFPDRSVPGKVYSSNITTDGETGIGSWTDSEIGTAIREGVSRDGTRLFPVMPYMGFAQMSDQDLAAVIAYLRTLDPIENQVPSRELPQPVVESLPPHQPLTGPVPHPDESNRIEYGAYLASIGNCFDCHTPFTPQGQPIMELAFAGGRAINGPWGDVVSGNLTSAPSGIPHYDEDLFIATMRTCQSGARELHQLMPCRFYDKMTNEDLAAIFAWMQTLPPIAHRVSNTDPPTPCNLCGGTHGLGEMN